MAHKILSVVKVKYSIQYFKYLQYKLKNMMNLKISTKLLMILVSFSILNSSKEMKITHGNGKPAAMKIGHQNMGSGKLFPKLYEIESLLCLKAPDVLGISECQVDEEAVAQLLEMGYAVETSDQHYYISSD